MTADARVQSEILAALGGEERLVASDIGVSVQDGVVTLTGEVDSLAKRLTAARAAEPVGGVRAVANDIAVRLPQDHGRTDADIAHDAVNALMWDTEVPDKAIIVRVQDRWLWLVGEVEWHFERLAAENAVENIAGVKGVTNLIQIKRRAADPNVQAHIEAAMRREPLLAARTVDAKVRGGCVELSGTLQSLAECEAARRVAWSAPGISSVEDRLEVVS